MNNHTMRYRIAICSTLLVPSLYMYATEHDAKHTAHEYISLARVKTHAHEWAEAETYYKKALALDSKQPVLHFHLANALFQQHKLYEAHAHYATAARLLPEHAEIHCNLGICTYSLGNNEESLAHFYNAIKADPTFVTPYLQLGLVLEKENRLEEALTHFNTAIKYDPKNADIPTHVGVMLKKQERFDEAVDYFRKAYTLKPHDFNTIIELANVLNTIDEYEEALKLYAKALELQPTSKGTLYNFGYTLKKMGHLDHAINVYKQVLAMDPDYALAHFSLGMTYLAKGDFERGWLEYEWRWQAYDEKPREFTQPMWDGYAPLKNKKLFVYAEQGYGDTFQFIRYLKKLKKTDAHIIFYAQSPLQTVLRLCPYIDEVVTFKDPLPEFDYQIPLMSLPFVCNTTLKTVPADIPYLYADETLTKEWHHKLAKNPSFKIGICWQGNAQYQTAQLRRAVAAKSLHVNNFKALAHIDGVELYSLQRINGTDQMTELDGFTVHTFDGDFDNSNGRFMDTAAVIKNLDLVITVDTSIGHFAAALGTPTWILLPNPADWRWMIDRDDTPWYPNVRLFRQDTRGDWTELMNRVADALDMHVQTIKGTSIAHKSTKLTDESVEYAALIQTIRAHVHTLHASDAHTPEKTEQLAIAYALYNDITQSLHTQSQE